MRHGIAMMRRIARCRRGGAVIELVMLLPFLVVLLAGLFDFGSSVMNSMALEASARAGAQYALSQPSDTTGIAAAVTASSRLTASTLTVTSTSWCECPDGTSVSCSGSCGANVVLRRFVNVQVTQPFTSLLPYPAFIRPTTLTGSVTIRVT